MTLNKEAYLDAAMREIPRLLGMMDKNPLSTTYGCFDREFWHYATTDMPSARKQEAVLSLALLYKLKHSKNPYYNSEKILQFIKASLNYWSKIQEKNNSFNEWYPKESSFVASSFSLYAITETMLILNIDDLKLKQSVFKTAEWISSRKEKRVMNQETGSALALYNSFLVTGEKRFKKAAESKIDLICKNQNKEGWFVEYGGVDIGYLSLAIDYLAKLYKKTKIKKILNALEKACGFLSYFIHPDFTFGGIYGSRNTEYLIPHGFEILSGTNKDALLISSAIKESLTRKVTFPNSLDDRYLCQILYTWIQAYIDFSNKISREWHFKKKFSKIFSEAGIYILSNDNFYMIINYKKAGVFRLFLKKQKKQLVDSGIFIELKGKKLQSSWFGNSKSEIQESLIIIRGNFVKYKNNKTNPLKYALLRVFQYTFGRSEKISLYVKEKLRDFLITKNKKQNHFFERKIRIADDEIEVEDKVNIKSPSYSLLIGDKIENIYVPSSNYFDVSDLETIGEKQKINKSFFSATRKFSNKK